jgi:hypothetical protein
MNVLNHPLKVLIKDKFRRESLNAEEGHSATVNGTGG